MFGSGYALATSALAWTSVPAALICRQLQTCSRRFVRRPASSSARADRHLSHPPPQETRQRPAVDRLLHTWPRTTDASYRAAGPAPAVLGQLQDERHGAAWSAGDGDRCRRICACAGGRSGEAHAKIRSSPRYPKMGYVPAGARRTVKATIGAYGSMMRGAPDDMCLARDLAQVRN
jgi:hypothetical protein